MTEPSASESTEQRERRQPLGNGGSRPVPDPTELTDKAIAKLQVSLTEYIDGQVRILAERIAGEKDLTKERFEGIERVRIEQKADTKAAVDAALTAQKEQVREQVIASDKSIAKSEAATTKLLEQQAETSKTQNEALGGKIEDVKERVGRIESVAVGGIASRTEARESNAATYGAMAAVIGVIVFALTVIGFIVTRVPA